MTDQPDYLRQREEEKSSGIAWAQRCLEGENKNVNMTHESGLCAENFLKELGWEKIDHRFRNHGYKHAYRVHRTPSETRIYQSPDHRFQVTFSYFRFSIPLCFCGFRKIDDDS